ncbi:hypothetical protein PDL71_05145 [Lacibacter sp. MH-610]|uniref:hypothetical protein n=1 Tax=Lacibacter sp. MH-610 TaxID=3020883 RepID=UPI003891A3EC
MKTFKLVEIVLNAALIVSFVCVFAVTQSLELLFLSYFIVGGVQLLSMFFHVFKGWFSNHNIRFVYYFFVLFIGALCFGGIGFFILLYTAPLMASFYVFICYRELKILQLRELVHLK